MAPPDRQSGVERAFINQERVIGSADYGTEFRFWYVRQAHRLVPVRKLDGAELVTRGDADRIPPGVISRIVVRVELPVGSEIVLLVSRPKAVRLSKRERHTFWLSRHGTLLRRPATPPVPAPVEARLPSEVHAALARQVLQQLVGGGGVMLSIV